MSITPLLKSADNAAVPNGVRPSRKRWIVSVRQAYLGSYEDLADAIKVRRYFEDHHSDVTDTKELLRLLKAAQDAGEIPADNVVRQVRASVQGADRLTFGALVVCRAPNAHPFIGTVLLAKSPASSVIPIGGSIAVQSPNEYLTLVKEIDVKAVV